MACGMLVSRPGTEFVFPEFQGGVLTVDHQGSPATSFCFGSTLGRGEILPGKDSLYSTFRLGKSNQTLYNGMLDLDFGFGKVSGDEEGFLVAQLVKNPPAM